MKRKRKCPAFCLAALAALLLFGCRQKEYLDENAGKGQYSIYYLNTGMTKTLPTEYITETKEPLELIQEPM